MKCFACRFAIRICWTVSSLDSSVFHVISLGSPRSAWDMRDGKESRITRRREDSADADSFSRTYRKRSVSVVGASQSVMYEGEEITTWIVSKEERETALYFFLFDSALHLTLTLHPPLLFKGIYYCWLWESNLQNKQLANHDDDVVRQQNLSLSFFQQKTSFYLRFSIHNDLISVLEYGKSIFSYSFSYFRGKFIFNLLLFLFPWRERHMQLLLKSLQSYFFPIVYFVDLFIPLLVHCLISFWPSFHFHVMLFLSLYLKILLLSFFC